MTPPVLSFYRYVANVERLLLVIWAIIVIHFPCDCAWNQVIQKKQTIKTKLIIQWDGSYDEHFSFLISTSYSLFHLFSNFIYTLLVQNPGSFFICRINSIVPVTIRRSNNGIKDGNNNDNKLFWDVTGLVRQTTTKHIKNIQKKAIGKTANTCPIFIFNIPLNIQRLSLQV